MPGRGYPRCPFQYSKPIAPSNNSAPSQPVGPSCSPKNSHAKVVDVSGSTKVAILATVAEVVRMPSKKIT